jgi:hypothetical protein
MSVDRMPFEAFKIKEKFFRELIDIVRWSFNLQSAVCSLQSWSAAVECTAT